MTTTLAPTCRAIIRIREAAFPAPVGKAAEAIGRVRRQARTRYRAYRGFRRRRGWRRTWRTAAAAANATRGAGNTRGVSGDGRAKKVPLIGALTIVDLPVLCCIGGKMFDASNGCHGAWPRGWGAAFDRDVGALHVEFDINDLLVARPLPPQHAVVATRHLRR